MYQFYGATPAGLVLSAHLSGADSEGPIREADEGGYGGLSAHAVNEEALAVDRWLSDRIIGSIRAQRAP